MLSGMRALALVLVVACVPMMGTKIDVTPYGWNKDGARVPSAEAAVAGVPAAEAEVRASRHADRKKWYVFGIGLGVAIGTIVGTLVAFDANANIAAGSIAVGGGLATIGMGLWAASLGSDANDHMHRAIEVYNAAQ